MAVKVETAEDTGSKFCKVNTISKEEILDIQIFGEIPSLDDPDVISLVDTIETTRARTIQLTIMSYGGSLDSCMAIYNALKSRRDDTAIITIANSMLASGAVFIFMAGHERFIYPYTFVMIHFPTVYEIDGSVGNVNNHMKAIMNLTSEFIAKEMKATLTEHELETIKAGSDLWLTAKQALERKIATRMIGEEQKDERTND